MTQATKSALADAETLHLFASYVSPRKSPFRAFAQRARDIGSEASAWAVDSTTPKGRYFGIDVVAMSYWRARAAARLAFRAVPGLRG